MKSNNFFSGSHQFPEITIQMRNRHAFNYGDRERIFFPHDNIQDEIWLYATIDLSRTTKN